MWIVATPSGEILLRQLELEMEVVPLFRNFVFPRVSRPYYIHLAYGPEIYALRTQTRQLAESLGVDLAKVAARGFGWMFADPDHRRFGETVPSHRLAYREQKGSG